MMAARSESFDYVIIGAGSAGCTLANRLSAGPQMLRRILIEDGHGVSAPPVLR